MSCGCESILPYVTKDTSIPITDSFGPFHDETILSGVDRVLYFFGGQKMALANLKALTNVLPCDENEDNYTTCNSQRSVEIEPESLAKTAVRFLEHPIVQEMVCPHCGNKNKNKNKNTGKLTSLLKTFDSSLHNPIGSKLKRSFSLCSLACQKVKEKLSSSFAQKNVQWLWTRRRVENCHQIYEIFQDSDINAHPNMCHLKNSPKMIIVVTPKGVVVPFETVTCHF